MREGVLGIGVDRLDCGFTRRQVIRVRGLQPAPVAVGGLNEHSGRAHLADHPADIAAQFMADGELAIAVAQEPHVVDPDGRPRGGLLLATDPGDLGAGDCRVESARIAVGDDAVGDLEPLTDPLGHGAGGPEIHVIGMGRDDQNGVGRRVVQGGRHGDFPHDRG